MKKWKHYVYLGNLKKQEKKKNEWVCHEKLQIRALKKPGGNILRSPKSRQLLPPGLPPGRPMGIWEFHLAPEAHWPL